MFRRSRYSIFLAFLIVIHIFIIAYINDVSVESMVPKVLSTAAAKPVSLHQRVLNRFENDVLVPFRNSRLKPTDPMAKLIPHLDRNHRPGATAVQVPEAYMEEPGPPVAAYDPRITFATILKHLVDSLAAGGDTPTTPAAGLASLQDLSVPFFHWADYANLSILHQYQVSPVAQKPTCQALTTTTNNKLRDKRLEIFEVETFCVDDAALQTFIDNEYIPTWTRHRAQQIQDLGPQYSAGLHVHRYGGRSTKDNKILHSKSFLHDFMPTPYSMVLLLPVDTNNVGGDGQLANALQVGVNQEPNGWKRLVDTNSFRQLGSADGDASIDVHSQLQQLIRLLDTNPGYQEVKHNNSQIPYQKPLAHEMFVDPTQDIYDAMSVSDTELNIHDWHYRHALHTSLTSPYPFKYFFEAKMLKKDRNWELGGHYDWRFFGGIINYTDRQGPVLHSLINGWFRFVNSYKINTWIAHGSLLSWFWNGVTFPWDIDFDVQMPITELHTVCRRFNQSLVMDLGLQDQVSEVRYGRFFLDCGTFIGTRNNMNGHNNIDARFIDVDTGLYIDITGLALTDTPAPRRYDQMLPEHMRRTSGDHSIGEKTRNEYLQVYNCKNKHFLSLNSISPLRLTAFEGQLNYIPNDYRTILINEYKQSGIEARKFKTHSFLPKLELWDLTKDLIKFVKAKYPGRTSLRKYRAGTPAGNMASKAVIDEEFSSDTDYLSYLWSKPDALFEYLVINDVTDLHRQEMDLYTTGHSTKPMFFDGDLLTKRTSPLRHDLFNFEQLFGGYRFQHSLQAVQQVVEAATSKTVNNDDSVDEQSESESESESEVLPKPVVDAIEELDLTKEEGTVVEVKVVEEAPPVGDPVVEAQTDEHLSDPNQKRPFSHDSST
ncbi:hypothetical protein PSN45_001429 [Yamadazyma tenuis]|uniref:LicD/FKTN/FKRP nucleotidyltransferase domain-containing protein n=1 Tax=Candida tenuis (strain ATCC 10573 / BCRC 21748 / CBS 615 / JCM 9827 / NBRC 10315 / NRRL Y-1498 / VKM Y-70) TaxID=590646 RepID=G3BC39_CANTC|nr:uncharacterized protein CANTEDRAFT_137250 [Yamadazyma tenuis ATCC 10573]EGV60776.1 hypothetical protein CANTEDRAFT_137250 [Yamadazyma tenuis ATCC 10573]WEJ93952.1 hypothetical protein PSN45_001429 [Yamadazyma tenuis]